MDATNELDWVADGPWLRVWAHRVLHFGLFVCALATTTAFGSVLAESFDTDSPLTSDALLAAYTRLIHPDHWLHAGLAFSVPLMLILLAHELGHYLTCRRYRVNASLPYFLPSPTLLGTFGAFIRIKSPIYTRRILFDIGASGPFAGFLVLLPFLFIGIAHSKFLPAPAGTEFVFGTPLLVWIAERMHFGVASPAMVRLHPMAMAAWAGLLATAINLLPVGQLDGGHILYSLIGERGHRRVSIGFLFVLVLLGFFYWPWWVWAVVLFFIGRRHPLVYDQTPVTSGRKLLGVAAFFLLLFSISVVPVATR